MGNYGQHFSTIKTPQNEQARADQVKNSAGGFAFQIDCWKRLDRWLILGAEGGTYYASEQQLTRENAQTILECLAADGLRTVKTIAELSERGRAPKNDPAIFALALAAADPNPATRQAALAALPRVCRIGTHLFHFARDVEQFRGWGRGLRNAIARWYTERPVDRVGYDVVKYQQRDGWSHRDLLRLAHPHANAPEHEALFRYVVAGADALGAREVKRRRADKSEGVSVYRAVTSVEERQAYHPYRVMKDVELPKIVRGFELAKHETDSAQIASLIQEHGLTHEMIPTEAKNSPLVWEALLAHMPMTAMVRNLAKMTAVGLLAPMSAAASKVAATLRDREAIHKARLHPLALLSALRVYRQGHGERGKLRWEPVHLILDALDQAFYLAFETIVPTGKNILLGVDISGSMESGTIAGVPGITPRVGAGALAMVTARTEQNWHCVGFTSGAPGEWQRSGARYRGDGVVPIAISPRQRLDDVCATMAALPMGRTDCALPMLYAMEKKLAVDAFLVLTDCETWAGEVHPFQALQQYRQQSGRAAKLIVVGMTSTGFSIAPQDDAGCMDVVGFDTASPSVISDFIRGGDAPAHGGSSDPTHGDDSWQVRDGEWSGRTT